MARVRTSLKERGQEILGLKRRERAERALLNAWSKIGLRPSAGTGKSGAETAAPTSNKTNTPRPSKGRHPDVERRIESLLDAEASAAIGEDDLAYGDTDRFFPDKDGSLSPVEWISPEPVTMPRPDPAPPPLASAKTSGTASTTAAARGEERQSGRTSSGESSAVSPRGPKKNGRKASQASPTVEPSKPASLLSVPLTAQEQTEMLGREDVLRYLAALEQSIRTQYERIQNDSVSNSQQITEWCHRLLAEARAIVIYHRLGDLPRAELYVEEVRARLDRAEASEREWQWPVGITVWEIACFLGFMYLIFDPSIILSEPAGQAAASTFIHPRVFLPALLFGGIGSVTAAFFHLFKRCA